MGEPDEGVSECVAVTLAYISENLFPRLPEIGTGGLTGATRLSSFLKAFKGVRKIGLKLYLGVFHFQTLSSYYLQELFSENGRWYQVLFL